MIRTDAVKLTTIKAVAYRQKQSDGDVGIVIIRPDQKQPGIAAINKKTGEPAPTANTNTSHYPVKAFKEAFRLTAGMQFRKQGSLKVTKSMFASEKPAKEPEVISMNEAAYEAILNHYTDKNGKLSYDMINKELIRFAHSSSIVRNMIAENMSLSQIREYIVFNKFRNIADNRIFQKVSSGLSLKLLMMLIKKVSSRNSMKRSRSCLPKIKKDK